MPDIGATLREARMRARIDISEVEAGTKIRAKYLRALENEEWDLLPGPTYVKSFLRTYAEALDLDAKLLVDEYKLRHERLSEVELQPITPRAGSRAPGRQGARRFRASVWSSSCSSRSSSACIRSDSLANDDNARRDDPRRRRATRSPRPSRAAPPAPPRRVRLAATGPVSVPEGGGRTTRRQRRDALAGGAHAGLRSRRFRLRSQRQRPPPRQRPDARSRRAAELGTADHRTGCARRPLPAKRPVCNP